MSPTLSIRLSITALAAGLTLAVPSGTPSDAGGPDAGRSDAPAYGALGANFNERLDSVNFAELDQAGARWVRGFLAMPEADVDDPAGNPAIQKIRELHRRGYRTIFTLKFPYNNTPFPAPGSPELAREIQRLDKVLPLVMGTVDIIEIGNEPFIESLPAERTTDKLNPFYEAIARHVIDYRTKHSEPKCATTLYMGALNRLDLPERRTPATERWMTFVHDNGRIAGVDIHPHVNGALDDIPPFLDYILPRMRHDQTFLATEFSVVWAWKDHLSDQIDAGFAQQYGYPAGTLVWQVIGDAIETPFSRQKWLDFLTSNQWFWARRDSLRNAMRLFRDTGRLAVATYGFKQGPEMAANWGPDKTPWLLNSVFARFTVEPQPDGLSGQGYWFDQFKSLATNS